MPLPLKTFAALTRLHRKRLLPVPGKILMRKGQWVEPDDVVAQALLEPRHITLDIALGLGVLEDEAEDYLQVEVGSLVANQDILAGPVGYAQRVVRSPTDGRIVWASAGKLTLQVSSQPEDIKAELPGRVIDLIADQGVVIELSGSLAQGVWGNGLVAYGKYLCLANEPEAELYLSPADTHLAGSICVGGICSQSGTLTVAQELGIGGLVLSGLEAGLFEAAARLPFPTVVLEGFGRYPLNPEVHQVFLAHSGREMALNAKPWDKYTGMRPEIIIPQYSEETTLTAEVLGVIQPGQKVRVISPQVYGVYGILIDLPGIHKFPSGVLGLSATVLLENGSEDIVPLANLEFTG